MGIWYEPFSERTLRTIWATWLRFLRLSARAVRRRSRYRYRALRSSLGLQMLWMSGAQIREGCIPGCGDWKAQTADYLQNLEQLHCGPGHRYRPRYPKGGRVNDVFDRMRVTNRAPSTFWPQENSSLDQNGGFDGYGSNSGKMFWGILMVEDELSGTVRVLERIEGDRLPLPFGKSEGDRLGLGRRIITVREGANLPK